ncbi:conserved oligomeric Golgi complex subunit 2-like [Sycon ciliatum]|uniref:conserved oligomeric Golgi complex subunit 2-like n=1 Tax=Sycon ciliatum TaxID=27933 RepID=UPI0020A8948B|eukprot:scpid42850/ scgid11789/ Conserved oligomeric Golgi complex subunit 2; Component of oligomeric Golgi complex 2; Low density lipoprotein receptor defect C-complementing protein
MAEEAASSLLGASNTRFCFAREEFLRESFDVDEFISSCRRRVSLETLHEDLSVHYKALRNAMMELINKDYADFVSLSSSLVGLEKEIGDILVPLGQLREEVSTVKGTVDNARGKLEQLLERRAECVKKKAALERYLVISQKIDSIEQFLRLDGRDLTTAGVGGDDSDEDVLERVTSAFNELQFQVEQAEDSAFVSAITPRISAITLSLQSGLAKSFQAGLASNDSQRLHRCLRTYAAIDRTSAVEALFKTSVVRPYLSPIISSRSTLDDIYPPVVDFINKHCATLVTLTSSFQSSSSSSSSASSSGDSKTSLANIQGIDFLVNAVWPEIVTLLCTQTPTIFAAGNPDTFHENYTKTMDFLSTFERLCRTQASVKRLRNHASYKQLLSKWSLPVYFQLRFQEIAWALEEVLYSDSFSSPAGQGSDFRCVATSTLWSSLERCWSRSVYLQSLAHRFWKLTLQILSRYCCWVTEIQLETSSSDNGSRDFSAGTDSGNGSRGGTSKPPSVSPPTVSSGGDSNGSNASGLTASCRQLVDVILDTEQLLHKLPAFLSDEIQPRLATFNSSPQLVGDGMLESRLAIKQLQPRLSQLVSNYLCQECLVHLDAARTIPRLYRHTNRTAPTAPSAYICALAQRMQAFSEEYSRCAASFIPSWCGHALAQLCIRYKAVVSEILGSVKKTEESLQRLKRTRRSATQKDTRGDDATGELSDEDKIRLQLFLDVRSLAEKMEDLGYQLNNTDSYAELFALVQPSASLMSPK